MTEARWANRIVRYGEAAPAELRPNPRNWRRHPRAQQDALAGVLTEVGWAQGVVVNERTGHLVDGHARVDLAVARKEPAVPVVYVDLSPEEEAKVLATLDPLGAMAGADPERLAALVRDVTTDDAALRSVVRDLAEANGIALEGDDEPPEAPEPEVDRAEELGAQWGTAQGQVWAVGEHRLVVGDATDPAVIARALGGKAVGAVFTDPPYGNDYDPAWLEEVGRQRHGLSSRAVLANNDGSLDVAFLWRYPRRFVWGFPYVFDADATGWVVWDKQPGVEGRGIVTPVEMASTTMRVGFDLVRVMWGGYYRAAGEPRMPHPTQKPLGVYQRFVEAWTAPSEVILDPFMGSGAVPVVAQRTGRVCAAVEIDPGYVAVTLERLAQMGLEPRLVPEGDA